MSSALRVIFLEDDPNDADLVKMALERDGIHCDLIRVDTRALFQSHLDEGGFDLILADYRLPAFDGLTALRLVRGQLPDMPFILVSGALGEDPAIEALTEGATDYVLKHRLARLAPAVRRALAEARERAERRRAECEAKTLLKENRYLIDKLLAIQEEERRHLARELHDEIGQALTAIQAEATMVRNRGRDGDEQILSSAQVILDVSSDVYGVVHSMLDRLRPAALDNLGLVEAIRDAINTWQTREPGIDCRFECRGELPDLGERVNITLYRTVQECLTNIVNHACASRVRISIGAGEHDQDVSLVVQDDGNGMDPGHRGRGLGLIGMRERAEAVGGRFELQAAPERGVMVTVTIPVPPEGSRP